MAQQTCGQGEHGTTDVRARRTWHNRHVGKENTGTANMGKETVSTADM